MSLILKFLKNEVCLLIILFTFITIITNTKCQASYHFNPSAPPVYPMGLLPDGTKKRPFLMYASAVPFINLLSGGAPVSELSLKFKAGMSHTIVAAVPLTVLPKVITFTPWDLAHNPKMTTTITFVGKYPINASSLIIENCKCTFTPGSQLTLNDNLKGINIFLMIKNSELMFVNPVAPYVIMRAPHMINFQNVKMKRGSPKDIQGYFSFTEPELTTVEISISELEFSGPPPGKDTTKNNLLYFNNRVDCKSFELNESKIQIVNIIGFNKPNVSHLVRRTIVNKSNFKNAGLFNFQNSKDGQVTVSDISIIKSKIDSSRMIQIVLPTKNFITERINLVELEFLASSGAGNQILPRFILVMESLIEMHINNWYFSKVKSIYDDNKAPNILVHIAKSVISLNIFDVDAPDIFEIGSYVSTFGKITQLKVDRVKTYFSKGYFDKFEGEGKSNKGKRRNNFLSVFSGVQASEITNVSVTNNIVVKSSYILIFNAKDKAMFSEIMADGNLVSSSEKAKVSLISVLQTKDKLTNVQIKNSKFEKNYSVNEKAHPNFSACFTFNGKIDVADVINTKFINNRAHEKNFDNFDITATKTNLDRMSIVSSMDDELKKKYSGISNNGGGFEIFGQGIFIKQSSILCTAKSANLKGKKRSYKLNKQKETLIFKKKVDDFYKFKC
jgi:hypothetical protein